jgi:CubicO group peptidase (beta-lactamase class C family)
MAMLPSLMEFATLPAISIAVVHAAEVVWARGTGVANSNTGKPLSAEATFEAASMSKPVFAYVVMKLVDEKLLDLDRPLVQYRRPDYLADDPQVDLITARDVLRHSSGLPNWRRTGTERVKPTFKPGSRFGYSGEGIFWLQLVVEQLTGQGLDALMRARLFEPLGLKQSTYAWNANQDRWAVDGRRGPDDGAGDVPFQFDREWGNLMLQVAADSGKSFSDFTYEDVMRALPAVQKLIQSSPKWPAEIAKAPLSSLQIPANLFPNAAASLRTTPSEYAKIMTLMMPHSKRAPWEISEGSRRAMLTPQLQVRPGSAVLSRGLGWEIEQQPASQWVFHHGGSNGNMFKTYGVGDENGRAIVVFTNGGWGDRIAGMVCRAATGLDFVQD